MPPSDPTAAAMATNAAASLFEGGLLGDDITDPHDEVARVAEMILDATGLRALVELREAAAEREAARQSMNVGPSSGPAQEKWRRAVARYATALAACGIEVPGGK